MNQFHIAVDGVNYSGKSTICALVADRLNFVFLSSGNFYRMTAYLLDQKELAYGEKDEQLAVLKAHTLGFAAGKYYVDEQDVTHQLRTDRISLLTAHLATKPHIRTFVNEFLHAFIQNHPRIIMDGRDIATKIMPNATLKFFFTCSLWARTKRKRKALLAAQDPQATYCYVKTYLGIKKRDAIDQNRALDPLVYNQEDTIQIDTSRKNIEQVYELVANYIKAK